MYSQITSPQNSKVKYVGKLKKRSFRDRQRETVVEGGREIAQVLIAGITPVQVFVCPELLDEHSRAASDACRRLADAGRTQLYEIGPDVFARMAYREDSGGVLSVIPYLDRGLTQLPSSESPLVLVVEGAEKPGNLGAILRTADAAGVSGAIMCGDGTDVHNPNVIRASLGAVFALPIAQVETAEAVAWLKARHIKTVAASPDAQPGYTDIDYSGPVAVVVGSEATGLTQTWLESADELVRIPMHGKVDSLNVSVSTAIVLYEAVRQRARRNA